MKTITHTFALPYKSFSIKELVKLVEEKCARLIPEEFKPSVKLEFVHEQSDCEEVRDFYGFYLSYERPYTEEELKKIEAKKESDEKWHRQRQIENLEILIKKYPIEAKEILDKLE